MPFPLPLLLQTIPFLTGGLLKLWQGKSEKEGKKQMLEDISKQLEAGQMNLNTYIAEVDKLIGEEKESVKKALETQFKIGREQLSRNLAQRKLGASGFGTEATRQQGASQQETLGKAMRGIEEKGIDYKQSLARQAGQQKMQLASQLATLKSELGDYAKNSPYFNLVQDFISPLTSLSRYAITEKLAGAFKVNPKGIETPP